MTKSQTKPTVAERLNPKSPHFEPELLALREKAFPHLYPKKEA